MENDRFSAYYKAQKIVPEEEWDTFIDALRQHLPTTFRVAGSRQYVSHIIPVNHRFTATCIRTANILNTTIKNVHVPALSNAIFEDQLIPPPVQIPWYLSWFFAISMLTFCRYPEGLAWQFNVPKKVLRKSPEFKKFHSFLVFETEVVRLPPFSTFECS